MSRLIQVAFIWLASMGAVGATGIPVLTYHDIAETRGADAYAVTPADFRRHLQYLRNQNYVPINLKRLIDAREGRAALPEKPVLLTFDDGLESYAKVALPLMREYGYPSVLAIVTSWVDGRSISETYHGRLLNWDDLRKLKSDPLVEIISHSDDLHRGIRSNLEGNKAPAGITRMYLEKTERHENETAYRERVRADLARSRDRIVAELGRAPAAIAWPFGKFNQTLIEEAARVGMHYHLTLEDSPSTLETLPQINRGTFYKYRRLQDFDDMLTHRKYLNRQYRFVEVSLDPFAGKSSAEQERILSKLLSRLQLLRVNAVVISPFTRDFRKAFFRNSLIPVDTDLLNRVLHQIQSRLLINYLCLKLPATLGSAHGEKLYTDLARLNEFHAVMLTGSVPHDELRSLIALFRYANPMVHIGLPLSSKSNREVDFHFVHLATNQNDKDIGHLADESLSVNKPVYFILERFDDTTVNMMTSAMRALRSAGAWHYGYDNDDFVTDSPPLLQIVPELISHTIRLQSR
ncbi:MAG TPA: polysaccharide deacetylase family protein [Sulfuricaulis sp.]|nr:polysaccharide deacetylase family protein [Sulfuricaulis sp.]